MGGSLSRARQHQQQAGSRRVTDHSDGCETGGSNRDTRGGYSQHSLGRRFDFAGEKNGIDSLRGLGYRASAALGNYKSRLPSHPSFTAHPT